MSKSQSKPSKPATANRYDVYVVQEYQDAEGKNKTNWMQIGVAFPHKNGDGLNVELQANPINGKLVIRLHEERERTEDK